MFAYPDKTRIVLYGWSPTARTLYYRLKKRFNVLGLMAPEAQRLKLDYATVISDSMISALCADGVKLIVIDNIVNVCNSLLSKRGLKLYDDFLPLWAFEYEMIDCLGLYNMCSPDEFARLLPLLMKGKKGAALNGNCQTEPIAKYLIHNERFSSEYILLKTTVVHRFTEKNIGILSDPTFLNSLSLFMTQKISINNSHCRDASSQLMYDRLPAGCKRVMINNFWFEGYFPQHKKNEHNVLTDVYSYGAFNWGDSFIDRLVSEGKSADEIFAAAHDNSAFDGNELDALIKAQFADMEAREAPCDIKISDYIRQNYKKEVLFYSANHPVNKLIKEEVVRILRFIGLYGEGESVTFRYEHALDSKPLLRSVTEVVYPAVLHRLGLDDCADKMFYSTLYGEFCSFDDYVRNYLLFCYDMQVGGEE